MRITGTKIGKIMYAMSITDEIRRDQICRETANELIHPTPIESLLVRFRMRCGVVYEKNLREWCETYFSELFDTPIDIFVPGWLSYSDDNRFGGFCDGVFSVNSKNIMVELKITLGDLNPKVPDYYYYQMQLYMACTNIDQCYYVQYSFKEKKCYIELVNFDSDKWINETYPKCIEFINTYLID